VFIFGVTNKEVLLFWSLQPVKEDEDTAKVPRGAAAQDLSVKIRENDLG